MSQTAKRNLLWSAVRNSVTRLGSVIVFVILTRLLPREQLGLFAVAMALIAFVEIFTEAGIGDSIVQRPEIDDADLTTALMLNIAIGLVVAGVLILGADPLAVLMKVEGLQAILRPMAIAIVLNAAAFVPQSLLRRRSQLKPLAFRSLIATLVGGALGIAMAFAGYGVSSLVAQVLVSAIVNTFYVWLPPEWNVLTRPSLGKARELLSFSTILLLSKLVYFLSIRAVEFFIVASIGPGALALYIMGSRISAAFAQFVSSATTEVSFIEFSRHKGDLPVILKFYDRAIVLLVAGAVPLFGALSALAPELSEFAYGANGHGSEAALAAIGLLSAFNIVEFQAGSLLIAVGYPSYSLFISMGKVAAIAVCFIISWHAPLPFLVNLYVGAQMLCGLATFYLVVRKTGRHAWTTFRPALPFLVGGALSYAIIVFARPIVQDVHWPVVVQGFVLGLLGLVVYLAFALLAAKDFCMQLLQSFRSQFLSPKPTS